MFFLLQNHDDADVDGQNGSGVNLNGNPAERRLRIEVSTVYR